MIERFASSINGTVIKDSSLNILYDAPLESMMKSAFESLESLDFVNYSSPQWVMSTVSLTQEQKAKYKRVLREEEMQKLFTEINGRISAIKKKGVAPVSEEDLASILLYTEESKSKNLIPIYKLVNSSLAERDMTATRNAGNYILNLLSALRKLPQYKGDVLYRGINGKINRLSKTIGSELSWPGFTSTTYEFNIAGNFAMHGDDVPDGGRYIFEIRGNFRGYDISCFSAYNEREILLEPETRYRVVEVIEGWQNFHGVTLIRVEVIDTTPIVCDITTDFTKMKEEIMGSAEWITKQLSYYNPYSELCLFYMKQLVDICETAHPKGEENRSVAGKAGAIESLLKVMKTHLGNCELCKWGCGALGNLTINSHNQAKAGELGAIESILKAISVHKSDETVCEWGFIALGNMTLQRQVGVIETVIDVMKTHPGHLGANKYSCDILMNISNIADNQNKIGKLGGIDLVNKAINTFVKDVELCRFGCGAIWNISKNEDNQVKAGQIGSIEAIVNALKTNILDSQVSKFGSAALINITLNDGNKIRAGKAGAICTTVEVLKKNIDDIEVCINCCSALRNMTFGNTENQIEAGKKNAILTISRALNLHMKCPELCESGCTALWNMTIIPDNQFLAIQANAVENVIETLKTHIDNPDVCTCGCGAIWNMSKNSSNKEAAKRLGIDGLLNRITERHKTNTELVDMIYHMQSEMNYGLVGQVIRAEVFGLKKFSSRVFKPFNIDYYK